MKTLFRSLAIAISIASSFSAFAAQTKEQDKTVKSSLSRIEENCKLVREYAPIFEWENVDKEVDRIVAEESKILKAMNGSKQAEELHAAVKELRSARLDQNPDRAVAAAEKVNTLAHDLLK